MFLEEYSDRKRTEIFADGCSPKLSRMSHSFNDPHWSYQYHLHREETELVYISQGEGTYNINTTSYPLKKGCILIVEQGAIHSLSSSETSVLSCWTCAISDYKITDLDEAGYMLPVNIRPCADAGEHEETIYTLFHEIRRLSSLPGSTAISACDSLTAALASIYYEIFRSAPVIERQGASSFARDVLIYINENYTEKITLKSLSETFHISADHISHEFAKVYGISPINYVIDRRLSEARWMLINTSDSLVSISHTVGYENTYHFSNIFQKRLRYLPTEFRELYQKN